MTILFFCANLNADPLTPLPTDFFDDKKIKSKKKSKTSKKKNRKKSYSDLIKNMESNKIL